MKKDSHRLPPTYFAAGEREFWLIDARGRELRFEIHARSDAAFVATAKDAEGYQRSHVPDAWYLLERARHQRGHWIYRLRQK